VDNWREIPEGLLLWRDQGKRDEAASFSRQSAAGSQRASIRAIWKRLRRCQISCTPANPIYDTTFKFRALAIQIAAGQPTIELFFGRWW